MANGKLKRRGMPRICFCFFQIGTAILAMINQTANDKENNNTTKHQKTNINCMTHTRRSISKAYQSDLITI